MQFFSVRSLRPLIIGLSFLSSIIVFEGIVPAQNEETLTQKLLKEPPKKLVAEARQRGNIVRGAILFHQGNINCAQCHRPKNEAERIGPDLSKLDEKTTDESLVESILNPNKVIKEAFRSYSVLMLDGEQILGQLVRQDERVLVLRKHDAITRAVELLKDDIDEFSESKISSMPDDLCNQLKSRQQFLDLLRYVLDIKDRGPIAHATAAVERKPISEALRGTMLIDQYQCTSCHQSKSKPFIQAKQAPDLRWSAKHLNPEWLSGFVSQPHQAKPGTPMPDLFASESVEQRKSKATALVHYLVALDGNQYQAKAVDPIAAQRGYQLFQSIGCVACHAPRNQAADEVKTADSIPLGDLTNKYDLDSLESFLKNPHVSRPSDRMPNLSLTHWEAQDLSHFLLQKKKLNGRLNYTIFEKILEDGRISLQGKAVRGGLANDWSPLLSDEFVEESAIQFEGWIEIPKAGDYRFLLESRGGSTLEIGGKKIVDLPTSANSSIQSGNDSIRLNAGKHPLKFTYQFLRGEKHLRLSWSIGNEAAVEIPLSQFSNSRETITTQHAFQSDAALVAAGKKLFLEYACGQCHTGVTDSSAKRSSRFETTEDFEKLTAGKGCLSGKPGKWPALSLTQKDRDRIAVAIGNSRKHSPASIDRKERVLDTLARLNCLACHDRDQMGGVSDLRNVHFTTRDLNLGEQGRIPPTLTGVGGKLQKKWMRDVLVNGRSVRPYMDTRMPKYSEKNISQLIDDLQTLDKRKPVEYARFKDQKEIRKTGLQLVGNQGLNCVACHTYQFKTSDTMPAVDLTEMAERLNKDWYYEYMLAPQTFSPNTVMPSFWPGGVAMRKDFLEGDSRLQVEAIWQYLLDGRQAGAPRGVVRKRLEIVIRDEAQMLRRSYPNIGKRGIGVGYPGGINIAYDAEQMRLGLIWSGKFADPGGVWTGQGSGQVRPLGRPFNLEKGPDLDDAESPWKVDEGRPPNHQFKGYDLDEKMRPTFRYQFGEIQVNDHFREQASDNTSTPVLTRILTLRAEERREGLAFRVFNGKKVTRIESGFLVDDKVVVQSNHEMKIEDTLAGKKLIISTGIKPGTPTRIEVRYRWKEL